MPKKTVAWILLLMVLLAGCTQNKIWVNEVTLLEPMNIEIQVCWDKDSQQGAQLKKLADRYNLLHYGEVSVTLQVVTDPEEYAQNIRTLAAADQLPDIFFLEGNPNDQSFMLSEKLMDFSAYLQQSEWDSLRGNLRFYPVEKSIAFVYAQPEIQLFYHSNLPLDDGYTIPSIFTDEFMKMCMQLNRQGITPVMLSRTNQSYLAVDLLFAALQTTADFVASSPESWKGHLERLKILYDYMDETAKVYDYPEFMDNWGEGKAAMLLMDSMMGERISNQIDIQHYTAIDSQGRTLLAAPVLLAAAKQRDGEKAKGVVDFVHFLLKERQQEEKSYISLPEKRTILISRSISPVNREHLSEMIEMLFEEQIGYQEAADWCQKNLSRYFEQP